MNEQRKDSVVSALRFIFTSAVAYCNGIAFPRTIMSISRWVSHCLFNSQFDAPGEQRGELRHHSAEIFCTKALARRAVATATATVVAAVAVAPHIGTPSLQAPEFIATVKSAARCSLERRLQPRDRSACSSSRALPLLLSDSLKIAPRYAPLQTGI